MTRKTRRGTVLLLAVLALGAAAGAPAVRAQAAAADAAADTSVVAAGVNAFAVDLYARLRPEEGNLFFSPYSISTALAMTYAGAAGNTAAQMADVLHFTLPAARLHPAYGRLIEQIGRATEAEGCELRIANALWGQSGYAFVPEFLQTLDGHYAAPLHQVDFVDAAEAARKQINDWVSEQTRERITDLVPAGVLNALTRLVLANAIYFKGDWLHPFEEGVTTEGVFWTTPEEGVAAPMMRQTRSLAYGESAQCQVLELPYAGEALSMVVLLPRGRGGLPALEAALTPEALAEWTAGLRSREVDVTLPKFKLTRAVGLGEVLEAMGMTDAFSVQSADFSGMTGGRDLRISAVLHKAFVDVNEQGTEAAAATVVVMGLRAAPAPPVTFRADHPFILLIRHRPTDAVLFMGRLADPSQAD
ncbi:MAG: serpin family protein [Candidatus Brocadiaceae bacterium]|nr:serpin family protein [Candidatus Brocadiaceae bacterium]